MYLLDTTHCLYLMAGFQRVQEKRESFGDSSVSTCTIVRGELILVSADNHIQRLHGINGLKVESW